MAYDYYDLNNWTGTSTDNWWSGSSGTGSGSTLYTDTSTGTTNNWHCWVRPRSYLVVLPEHWSHDDALALSVLVNVETKTTGWKVEYIIEGHVTIVDPDVEVRSLRDFLPLLTRRANAEDREKISAFFKARPIEQEDRDV